MFTHFGEVTNYGEGSGGENQPHYNGRYVIITIILRLEVSRICHSRMNNLLHFANKSDNIHVLINGNSTKYFTNQHKARMKLKFVSCLLTVICFHTFCAQEVVNTL